LQAQLAVTALTLSVSAEARRAAENALIAEALGAFDERAGVVRNAMKAKGYRVRDLHVATGGGLPRPLPAMAARALAPESMAPPAIEPGGSRLVVSVSGTIQLQH
jgi:predicted secreted protein